MEWLLAHSDDADIDEPLSDQELQQIFQSMHRTMPAPVAAASRPTATPSLDQNVKRCIAHNRCTFALTGRNYALQQWYHCFTCGSL